MSGTSVRAVLFTDLVGSTALAASIGDSRTDMVRERHFVSMRRAIAACGGTEVKTIGDAIMVQFSSAVSALDCAVSMQQAMARDNARADVQVGLRVGVSIGEVADTDGDVHGLPVVEASRLCAAAEGGEVLVADVVRHLAGSRSPTSTTAALSSCRHSRWENATTHQ